MKSASEIPAEEEISVKPGPGGHTKLTGGQGRPIPEARALRLPRRPAPTCGQRTGARLPGTLQLLMDEASLFLRLKWRREKEGYETWPGTHRGAWRPRRGTPRALARLFPDPTLGVSHRALPWRPHWSVSARTRIVGRCCRVLPQVAARVVLVVVFGLRVPEQHG